MTQSFHQCIDALLDDLQVCLPDADARSRVESFSATMMAEGALLERQSVLNYLTTCIDGLASPAPEKRAYNDCLRNCMAVYKQRRADLHASGDLFVVTPPQHELN
jgi:hypothetical protein